MAKPSSILIEHIYRMAGVHTDTTSNDADLIRRYAEAGDEQAFTTLMVRHGLMVWSICLRIVNNTQDAEEAYQSTFLALAHKVKKIRSETLVGWLHQVARQAALDARKRAKSCNKLQKKLQSIRRTDEAYESKDIEAYEELHGEIVKMPEKLRVALVLHYLEGKTQAQVAEILGVKESAVWDRLNRGKALLEKRLSARGLSIGAATLGSLLAEMDANAAIPPGLLGKTAKAALAFRDGKLTGGLAKVAQEVLKQAPAATPWWKTGWMITVLCVGGIGAVTGGIAWKAGLFATKADGPFPMQEKSPEVKKEPIRQLRQDPFGDPLPPNAIARIGTLRFRPTFPRHMVWQNMDVAFGTDAKTVISAHSDEGFIQVWEIATGRELHRIKGPRRSNAPGSVLYIATSPRTKQLVALRTEGDLWCWNLAEKTPRFCWKRSVDRGTFLAFAPDGKSLACGALEQRGGQFVRTYISVRSAATGKELRRLEYNMGGSLHDLTFSPDSALLAAVGDAKSVCLWDITTGGRLPDLECQTSITSMAFSPNGKILATASRDEIRLWDLAARKLHRRWPLKLMSSGIIAYIQDGKTILASASEQIRFLNATTGAECRPPIECLGMFEHNPDQSNAWLSVGFQRRHVVSSDDRWLASANGHSLNVWDLVTGEQAGPVGMPDSPIGRVAFSPDGNTLITDSQPGVIHQWDLKSGKLLKRLNRDPLQHLASCWDGLCCTEDARLYSFHTKQREATLVGWDGQTGAPLKLPNEISTRGGWAVSPDGRLAAMEQDGAIALYDLATAKNMRTLNSIDYKKSKGLSIGMNFFAFSEDGRVLISSRGEDLTVWEVASGRCLLGEKSIKGPPIASGAVRRPLFALSPDARWLAVRASNEDPAQPCAIQLWEVASGAPGPRVRNDEFPDFCLAFAPDGRTIAAGEQESNARTQNQSARPTILLWDIPSGLKVRKFTGHATEVLAMAFSSNGSRLASASGDCTVLLWDVGRLPRSRGTSTDRQDPKALWSSIRGPDAAEAYLAIMRLSDLSEAAIPLLREQLKPPIRPTQQQVEHWLADLNDDQFRIRNKAVEELKKCGSMMENALQRALKQNPPPDVRVSLERLLSQLGPARRRDVVRGVEVLERIGTPEAKKMLKDLAQTGDGIHATEARAALQRLARLTTVGQ